MLSVYKVTSVAFCIRQNQTNAHHSLFTSRLVSTITLMDTSSYNRVESKTVLCEGRLGKQGIVSKP